MNIILLREQLVRADSVDSQQFQDALKKIMDLLGVTTGDVASHHFTFGDYDWSLMSIEERTGRIEKYLINEIQSLNDIPLESEDRVTPLYVALDHGTVTIDGTEINDSVFYYGNVDYNFVDRKIQIDNLCSWIGESNDEYQRNLMLDDLQTLRSWDDDIILSSANTNEFISPTHDTEKFNEICHEILSLSKEKG